MLACLFNVYVNTAVGLFAQLVRKHTGVSFFVYCVYKHTGALLDCSTCTQTHRCWLVCLTCTQAHRCRLDCSTCTQTQVLACLFNVLLKHTCVGMFVQRVHRRRCWLVWLTCTQTHRCRLVCSTCIQAQVLACFFKVYSNAGVVLFVLCFVIGYALEIREIAHTNVHYCYY